MKWLVFSDSHGHVDHMKKAVETEKPDRVLHLGDVVRDARQLEKECPGLIVERVRGNCDGYAGGDGEPEEKELFLDTNRIWMLHGHTYRVKMGIGMLTDEARARGMKVVLFGHTHDPLCFKEGEMWVMNPGTVSGLPRATYGVIEWERGVLTCRIAESKPFGEDVERKRRWLF